MKKSLSILLSVLLLLGTLSVLTMLPAVAESAPVNLITNGDGSMGTWASNGYETAPHGDANWGMVVAANPYAWRTAGYNTNTMAAYGNAEFYWHDRGIFLAGNPNTKGAPSIRANRWNQTMQDIKIEAGKAYTVTAYATYIPVAASTDYKAWFDIAIVNKAGQFVDAVTNKLGAVTGKTYDLCDENDDVYKSLSVDTSSGNFSKFTYTDGVEYWNFGDFKEYSFTFAADNVIADYGLTDSDGDGYYDATLAFQNNSGLVLIFDNVTVYEVASILSGEGGYIEGDTDATTGEAFEVTAKPYYGNTFKGWYDEKDNLVSSELTYKGVLAKTITAKFNVYNQIVDGNFESGTGAGLEYMNSFYIAGNGGKNTLADVPANSAPFHGKKALYCAPATAANTNCDLVCMPVIVEKNKDYAFHFSFYSVTEEDIASYVSLHSEKNFTNGWTGSAQLAKWSVYANAENANAYSSYKFCGNISASKVTRFQPQIWQNYLHDSWTDLYFVFNPAEDNTIFADGEDTAKVWLTFALGNSVTNTYYIDNVSFTEVKENTFSKLSVVAGENGTVAPAADQDTLMPTNYFDLNGGRTATANGGLVEGSTRYPQMLEVNTYTATAENGFVFDGWYDENDNLVSTNATETFYIEGNYTAKFVEGSICDEGGYIVENGDGTITAKAYYGNVFLGWYQDDVLKSTNPTSSASLHYVARFAYNNQVIDGDFTVGDGIDAWKEYKLNAMTFAATSGKDDNTGLKATTKSDAMMSAKYPVTVKKNTTYQFTYNMKINSYEATSETVTPVYGMMVAGSTSGANTWGNWPTLGWYNILIRSSEDHSKFIKFEKFNSIENYQMHFDKIVAACGEGWYDVIVEFNTGDDTTTSSDGNMFAESDTATFYMAMCTNKSKTDIDYDNFSFHEKKEVTYSGKENVRVESMSIAPVAAGIPYSFKLLHADETVLETVKFNGKDITAQNGVYTVLLEETNEIAVTASNDDEYPEQGKDFDGNPLDKWDIPLYNIPVWEGNTVYQENIIFYPGRESVKLLYPIDDVISVRSYDLETYYVKGVDFDIVNGEFVLLEGTSIPVFDVKPLLAEGDNGYDGGKASDIDGYKVARYWEYDTCNYALSVTYTHTKKWDNGYSGMGQQSLLPQLPEVAAKLQNGEDVHIVFYGDSMTSGMSASGGLYQVYDATNSGATIPYGWWLPPFTPNWMTLFVEGLKEIYPDSKITWENLSLGGQTADWGDKNIAARYNLLDKEPDLFLIGYGINDDGKGTVTKDAFKASTAGIIDFIKNKKSDTSIILYGGNAVNDLIAVYEQATEKLFADALYELGDEYENVAATSLTDIYLDIAKSKEPADYMADLGVHANDFGCRIYAQTMLKAMSPAPAFIAPEGEFEEIGSDASSVVNANNGASAVVSGYSDADKLVNGYEETMGNGYLKVTANGNDDSAYDIAFPVELARGNKYLAHFKLRVLSASNGARFDIKADAATKTMVSLGYKQVVSGKDSVTFNWNANGYVDAYVVIDATDFDATAAYINIGLYNGGEFAVDSFSLLNQTDLAPTMEGAMIDTNGSTVHYVTKVNLPAYVSMNCATTHMIAKHYIDTKYSDRAYNFDFKIKEAGFASTRADETTDYVLKNTEGEVMREGNLYTTYEGFDALTPTARILARTEITISDNFGNSLFVLGTNNTDADKAIENGVYSRSLTQIKRLAAKALIENGYADLAASMINPISGKALYNCDINEVWAFVLAATK